MTTRLSEVGKYDDEWFCKMSLEERSMFDMLWNKCDLAGFIDVSLWKFSIDAKIEERGCKGVLESLCRPFKGLRKVYVRSKKDKSEDEVLWLVNYIKIQRRTVNLSGRDGHSFGIIRRLLDWEFLFPEIRSTYTLPTPSIDPTMGHSNSNSNSNISLRNKIRESTRTDTSGGSKPKTSKPRPEDSRGKDSLWDLMLDCKALTNSIRYEHFMDLKRGSPDLDWEKIVDYVTKTHLNAHVSNCFGFIVALVERGKYRKGVEDEDDKEKRYDGKMQDLNRRFLRGGMSDEECETEKQGILKEFGKTK